MDYAKLSVRKVLELSTAHLPDYLNRDISLHMIAMPTSCKEDEHGFMIRVLASPAVDICFPEQMREHISLARQLGCDFLSYEHTGPLIEGLKQWEEAQ
jgi:hypothetical protein